MHSHEEFLGCGVSELGRVHDVEVVFGEEAGDGVDDAWPARLRSASDFLK